MQALLRSYAWDWKDLRAELDGRKIIVGPADPSDRANVAARITIA
jgi:hypothetical protein